MADNMYLNERVAPSVIKYSNMTPLSFSAVSNKRLFFTSNQSTYGPGSVFRIPISSGDSFLDAPNSFLKFTYTNTEAAANTHTMCNSASSLFYRVRIYGAGSDLENILYYNYLHACVADLVLDPLNRLSRSEQGYGSFGTIAANTVFSSSADAPKLGCDECRVAQGASQTFCVPLDLSCLLGPGAKKLLPLFLTGPLTLEITIDSQGVMSSAATTPAFSLSNIAFHAQMITFDNSINESLALMTKSNGLFLHGTSWTVTQNAIASGTNNSWMIQERKRSIKSILFAFQDPIYVNAKDFRLTNRMSNKITQYQLKIGSIYAPPQQLQASTPDSKGVGEFLAETYKAIGEYANNWHSGLINIYNFNADVAPTTVGGGVAVANAAGPTTVGRALYGLDLDAFGKSDVESGINTILNNPITISIQSSAGYQNSPVAGANAVLAAASLNAINMLLHDIVFSVTPDGSFTASS